MKQLWAPWRMEYVSGDEPRPDGCLLCAIGHGQNSTDHVVENAELTFTVLNRYPYTSGHVMVCPHRHVADVATLTDAESVALFGGARRAMAALTAAMSPSGFNLGINQGEAAGQSLDHLHLHVVPRWDGDTNFMPVLADAKVLPEHLTATAVTLRGLLSAPAGSGEADLV